MGPSPSQKGQHKPETGALSITLSALNVVYIVYIWISAYVPKGTQDRLQ
jgi:hypothetical protein